MWYIVIIFDWDDTLMASTYLSSVGCDLDALKPLPAKLLPLLAKIEKKIYSLLIKCLQIAQVIIITNAENEWVEISARRFMPVRNSP